MAGVRAAGTSLRAGAVAGAWAGIASSAPGLAHAMSRRQGLWEPIRLIATMVGLPPGRSFALLPVAVGGMIHVVLSAAYGALYAATARSGSRRPIRGGLAYGLALHVVNLRILARAPRFRRLREETSEPVELLAHLLYGAALAAALRRSTKNAPRIAARDATTTTE